MMENDLRAMAAGTEGVAPPTAMPRLQESTSTKQIYTVEMAAVKEMIKAFAVAMCKEIRLLHGHDLSLQYVCLETRRDRSGELTDEKTGSVKPILEGRKGSKKVTEETLACPPEIKFCYRGFDVRMQATKTYSAQANKLVGHVHYKRIDQRNCFGCCRVIKKGADARTRTAWRPGGRHRSAGAARPKRTAARSRRGTRARPRSATPWDPASMSWPWSPNRSCG
jgi:hypothetical protein